VLCERDDLIRVPSGSPTVFDMGKFPPLHLPSLLQQNTAGWVPTSTGDPIAERFPLLA